MNIITDGDIEKAKAIVEFECYECGCVFEAEKSEYRCETTRRRSGYVFYHFSVIDGCPCCKHGVDKTMYYKPQKKKHTPKPEYPTWYRWISDINGGAVVDHAFLLQHIPDDIAEKLGVKPLK